MANNTPNRKHIVCILEILKKHSDSYHTLTQQQIVRLMQSEFDMTVDRKTVKRNIEKLIELEFPIYQHKAENVKDNVQSNWYYSHEFEYGELSLLIDSVLFADGLSQRHRSELIQKIEALTSKHFQSVTTKIDMNIYDRPVNGAILYTIENIRQAIANSRQLSFQYCDTGIDCELYPKENADGNPRRYTVSPYQIIAKNGHQYLICNLDQYDDLTHFRIDRITDSSVTDKSARKIRKLRGFENGLQLSEYVKAHPNLWSGERRHITFRCNQNMMNDIVDSFGTDLQIEQKPDDMILVHVYASENDMRLWAVQFSDAVEVLTPQSLREQIAETLRSALNKYETE